MNTSGLGIEMVDCLEQEGSIWVNDFEKKQPQTKGRFYSVLEHSMRKQHWRKDRKVREARD